MNVFEELLGAWKKIRNPFFKARSNYIKYYDTLPIDEKCILLESQHGTEISGNIFYIFEYLAKNEDYKDYKIYIASWIRHKKKMQGICLANGIKQVRLVTYASDQYFRLLACAKYLVNDNTFDPCFIKKEGQVYLNTWHGTPLKSLGRRMSTGINSFGNAQKNFVACDFLLCPNEHTRDVLVKDYMVENLSNGMLLYGGYPRNTVFFNEERRAFIREKYGLSTKRVYAYMPTFRGQHTEGGTDKNTVYLTYYLYELDRLLGEDEIFYLNLHPVAKKNINFKLFKKIRPFPENRETYEFLNAADCLVTDYSSVFFDYACTGRKIVLFCYDREEYLRDRGLYMDMDELPFPKAYTVEALLDQLRSEKQYDDHRFIETYCPFDNPAATQQICDRFILNLDTKLREESVPNNGKENVVIYSGNLAGNGITASLRNLLYTVDCTKRNYFIAFKANFVKPYVETIRTFPAEVCYFSILGDTNLTIRDRVFRRLFKLGYLPTDPYMKLIQKRIQQDWLRMFGTAKFHHAIQFNGYESDIILSWSQFKGNKIIFVHSDMPQEIRTKHNQRADVLRYAYQTFNRVATVTPDIEAATKQLYSPKHPCDNLVLCHNTINYSGILQKSTLEFELGSSTRISRPKEELEEILDSGKKIFINIGRYSPEKGQERLVRVFSRIHEENDNTHLVIIGGSVIGNSYQKLVKTVVALGIQDHVTLIRNLPNPFPVLKKCDYFVLSSFYEGFGLVLAEADILGLPVISTDIDGPRLFMQQNGGTLVENSEEGLYQGMCDLMAGKIHPMNVDYEAYNQNAVAEFESLFS